jgi:hypothetical protein
MTNTTTYGLVINNPNNGESSSVSASGSVPDDLVRLLQLSGQNPDNSYTLTISQTSSTEQEPVSVSSNSTTTVTSNHAEPLLHMLGAESDEGMMEQQADYDYRHQDDTTKGHRFDIKDYNFKGKADIPERLTSARFGSNALANEIKEAAFRALKARYQAYLEESNEGGEASPLTANMRDEFDKDPLRDEDPVVDGSHSPLSTIERQDLPS